MNKVKDEKAQEQNYFRTNITKVMCIIAPIECYSEQR